MEGIEGDRLYRRIFFLFFFLNDVRKGCADVFLLKRRLGVPNVDFALREGTFNGSERP